MKVCKKGKRSSSSSCSETSLSTRQTRSMKRSGVGAAESELRCSSECNTIADQHCLVVSDNFVTAREYLFQVMPQNPHLQPLDNYPPSVHKGMKLIFDLEFVNLATKLQQSFEPIEFYAKTAEYSWQITTLEVMGYDVGKLRHKFDTLGEISAKGKAVKDGREELGEKVGVLKAELSIGKSKISELETELQQLEAELKSEYEEVEVIKMEEDKLSEITKAIISIATAPWN